MQKILIVFVFLFVSFTEVNAQDMLQNAKKDSKMTQFIQDKKLIELVKSPDKKGGKVSSGTGYADRKYTIYQQFSLHKQSNGIEGTLALLSDKRFTDLAREKIWRNGGWDIALSEHSNLYKQFLFSPPLPSKLIIITSREKVVAKLYLEKPLAQLETLYPALKDKNFYLLTQDYSAGLGSYNGLITSILQVSNGKMSEVSAFDMKNHRKKKISLMQSLKYDWKIFRHGDKIEIFSVSCNLDYPGEQFVIDYEHYVFNGDHWLYYAREKEGFWENDHPFPSLSQFS